MNSLDRSLYESVNRFARNTSFAHGFMSAYAVYGGLVILGLLGFWAFLRARKVGALQSARVVWVGAATLIALGLNQPIIHFFGRPRPYNSIPGMEVLIARANDFSFPSDHGTVAGAMIVGLLLVDRKVGIYAAVFGLFLGFARVYVGAHYPGDIVAGLIWAGLFVAVTLPLATKLLSRPAEYLLHTGFAPVISSGGRRAI